MRGCVGGSEYLPFVRGNTLRTPDGGIHFYNRHWIEPDRAHDRVYLSEDVLVSLEMHGYMEARPVFHEQVWLYRITRDGCDALGVEYPLYSPEVKAHYTNRFLARRARELQECNGLYRKRDQLSGSKRSWMAQFRATQRMTYHGHASKRHPNQTGK